MMNKSTKHHQVFWLTVPTLVGCQFL